ncbi:phosphatase PAP2 family protein [Dermacoccaceae bacterium W4C1]
MSTTSEIPIAGSRAGAPEFSRPDNYPGHGAGGRPGPEAPEDTAPAGRYWFGVSMLGITGLMALVAVVAVFLRTTDGLVLDEDLMKSVGSSATAAMKVTDWLTYVSVALVAFSLLVCVVVALLRRRVMLAVGAAVSIAGANVSTRVLKFDVLERIDERANTLPSGHTTVAVSLGLAAVMVAPAVWRWLVVPIAGFVGTFVAAGTVVGQWHRPGDVLAAIAVCAVWASIGLALAGLDRRGDRAVTPGRALRPWLALLGSALVGMCFVGWGLRPADHDVELIKALLALGPIGVGVTIAVAWTAALAERHPAAAQRQRRGPVLAER